MIKVIVANEGVVSKYLGFEVINGQDLVEDNRCKNFIKENEKYFTSTKKEDYISFFERTGIRLEQNCIKSHMKFNFLGVNYLLEKKIYAYDLLILNSDDIYEIKKDILFKNGTKIRNVKKEMEDIDKRLRSVDNVNDFLKENSCYISLDNEKENYIYNYENFPEYEIKKDTDQLIISPYNDIFTLTYDGILYCNNKIYRKNVEYIFEQDEINKIIVFEDGNVEYLTASFGRASFNKKCDKVLYNRYSLILLSKKTLTIISKDYEEYLVNKSCEINIHGIDDVNFKDFDEDILELQIGKEKVIIDILEIRITNL